MKRTFDIGTAAGLALGLGSIFGSFVLEGGQVGALLLIPAMMIVFGGTIAAAMIGTSLSSVLGIGRLFMLALLPPIYDVRKNVDVLVSFAVLARREGLLALEGVISRAPDRFMQRMLRLLIDGVDPKSLRDLGETEIHFTGERHAKSAGLFQKMGGYSPTMGIIGTVMGLIATLASAGEDPNTLIHHIAGAFIATLWGVFMANLLWLPVYDKLRRIDEEEHLYMSVIVEGVIGIQSGEVPSVIRARLNSMLPPLPDGERAQ